MSFIEADYEWFKLINSKVQQYPLLDNIMIFFAEYVQYAFVLLILMLWLLNKSNFRVIAFQAMFSFTLAYSINRIIELFIYRERPFISHEIIQLVEHSANSSFPSDHATSAIAIAVTLWLSSHHFKYTWFILAVVIAFSRIWVGVHYPLDVVAGILNGVIIALFTHYLLFKVKPITLLIERPIFQGQGRMKDC
ncbi:phosphatase PAP2 family protein [Metabacillus dongyingensis]|uniref:phosphatase PAP2 family protein n=1 Tax=Metabacillus dongyingensis TaxID=2874282 RepID=UPI001FB22A01|nr:phosphatase PAP2 family protein [Metabacillus dongyingensis]UNJ81272.1 putative membrane-associated phospholipid phosphatase, PAP2 superfamily [Metabacillus dongyingensis]